MRWFMESGFYCPQGLRGGIWHAPAHIESVGHAMHVPSVSEILFCRNFPEFVPYISKLVCSMYASYPLVIDKP